MVEIDKKSLGVFFARDYVRVKMEIVVHRPLAAGHDYKIYTMAEGVTVTNRITRVALYRPLLLVESEIMSCFQSNLSEVIPKLNDRLTGDASDTCQSLVIFSQCWAREKNDSNWSMDEGKNGNFGHKLGSEGTDRVFRRDCKDETNRYLFLVYNRGRFGLVGEKLLK
ncbi:hypothetical protein PanWU01x14_313230 [Parasponia andersonii]|uniref:Uncharacterized protein n=1 Tax=Parasponia andersonii TaxID=3476 RepID=A0A2P5AP60_PARAD|nr:hypothetical protein PanWU01x14_313230 [Parasponia andersonii]